MFVWTVKVDISMLLMIVPNSKDYNKEGQGILLLSLTSRNVEIYGMHSVVFPFIEILDLTLELMDFISFLEMNLIFMKMVDFVSLRFFIEVRLRKMESIDAEEFGPIGASGCLTSRWSLL